MKLNKELSLVGLFAVVLAGCGSASVMQKEKFDTIGKVAIVGFSVQERLPYTGKGVMKEILSGDSSHEGAGGMRMTMAEIAKPAPHADAAVTNLKRALEKKFNWKVVALADLEKSAEYRSLSARLTKQPQARPMLNGKNMGVYVPSQGVETFLIKDIQPEERAALARSLGVDAILFADYQVELKNRGGLKHLVGAGDYHSQANVILTLYDRTSADPIWRDYAYGDETAESIEHALGFAGEAPLHQQAVAAMRIATDSLIAKQK